MPRLRKPELQLTEFGTVPVELLDAGSVVWKSEPATVRWLKAHDFSVDTRVKFGPVNRWRSASEVWARAEGLVGDPWPGGHVPLDWSRMRELGLCGAGWSGAMHERLTFEGVTFDGEG